MLKLPTVPALKHILLACLVAGPAFTVTAQGTTPRNTTELLNFSFAHYLGSGFYTTRTGRIFVFQLPFSYTFKDLDLSSRQAGYKLNLPVTLGLVDFENFEASGFPQLKDVGTISVLPGIEYMYPVRSNWSLHPFFDLGVARNTTNGVNIRVYGLGMKSFAYFPHGNNTLILGNRLLYANENKINIEGSSDFAVFDTGLDYVIPTTMTLFDHYLQFSLYYVNHYYFNDLVFVSVTDTPIKIDATNEIGFTVKIPSVTWLPDDARLGLGVQVGGDVRIYRLVFGMPLF